MVAIHSSATPSPLRSAIVSEASAPRPTLLVVDDEDGPRQSLRIVFKELYDVVLASSGTEALEIAKSRRVDAAVLDIRMAGMSGTELLGHLKNLDPRIEVVMLTAYETPDTLRQALRQGACDYLNKPFEITVLRDAVANAVKRRTLNEAMTDGSRRVQELQEELRKQQLQGEMARSQNEIYASVMHDIGSPLTAVSVMLQMVSMDLEATRGGAPHAVKEQLDRVNLQVARCMEISRRYLNYARERSTQRQAVRLNQVLTDVRELLRSHPSGKRHQLSVQLMPADLTLRMNGTDLIQVLLNLITNAFQASPNPLHVEVFGEYLDDAVPPAALADSPCSAFANRESFVNEPPMIALRVSDNGPGIPNQVLQKIFESYFTTKAPGEGTGLGLAIVRRLVSQAKGGIRVESEPGHGTTFTVFLPVEVG
ncbi:MAG: response regulator [Verrucomicrobia bacterium]|nr:response regulator [Verrucomicrobiota bacterium]